MGTSLVSSMGSTCPYDIGDILQTTNSKNPSERWNGTEWTQIKGKFLLGTDDSHTIGSTGGEFTHTLTVGEMPSHSHVQRAQTSDGNISRIVNSSKHNDYYGAYMIYNYTTQNSGAYYITTTDVGGNSPHNITPPLPCGLYLAKNSITILRGWYHE